MLMRQFWICKFPTSSRAYLILATPSEEVSEFHLITCLGEIALGLHEALIDNDVLTAEADRVKP